MTEYVQLLGSDDPMASGSALLWTEESRAAFNCPEGIQRFAGEIKLRLTKVSTYFFTRIEPSSFMGFPGTLFTVNDTGVTNLRTVGCHRTLSGMWDVLKRHFFTHRKMALDVVDAAAIEQPRGPPMRVGSLEVIALPGGTAASGSHVWSYLAWTATAPRFDAAKAKALGVRPGSKYAQLKRGESVASDTLSGRIVLPTEVTTSTGEMSTAVLILDVATPQLMPSLEEIEMRFSVRITTVVHVAPYHEVSAPVYIAMVRSRLIPTSGHAARHVVAASNPACRLTAFPTALANRIHLHSIAPDFVMLPDTQTAVFPPPTTESVPRSSLKDEDDLSLFGPSQHSSAAASSCDESRKPQWRYMRRYNVRRGDVVIDDPVTFPTYRFATAMLGEELQEAIRTHHEFAASVSDDVTFDDGTNSIVAVDFFGTGSAIPSKYRNVSCAVAHLRHTQVQQGDGEEAALDGAAMVLDAGEGSLGQMWNACCGSRIPTGDGLLSTAQPGLEELVGYVRRVRCVYVSHFHADHHLGIFVLLAFRAAHCDPTTAGGRVAILAPMQYVRFFDEMMAAGFKHFCKPGVGDIVAIDSYVDRPLSQCAHDVEAVSALLADLSVDMTIFHVDHPAWALGLRIDGARRDGGSLVYSGDTQPCESVARYSAGVDLLIHEATFADGMTTEARAKRHSTVTEAVAAGATAKALLLTHFSQRYPKLPNLNAAPAAADDAAGTAPTGASNSEGATTTSVGVAFDLLRVPGLNNMKRLAALTPMFQALAAEYDAWGDGTSKRLRDPQPAVARAPQQTAAADHHDNDVAD